MGKYKHDAKASELTETRRIHSLARRACKVLDAPMRNKALPLLIQRFRLRQHARMVTWLPTRLMIVAVQENGMRYSVVIICCLMVALAQPTTGQHFHSNKAWESPIKARVDASQHLLRARCLGVEASGDSKALASVFEVAAVGKSKDRQFRVGDRIPLHDRPPSLHLYKKTSSTSS